MTFASPFVQLLGTLSWALIYGAQIFACVLFFRRGLRGPWIMLAGAVASAIAALTAPFIYILMEWLGTGGLSSSIDSIMYFTLWNWIHIGGEFCFVIGLLLTALGRRALDRRAAELEAVLAQTLPSGPGSEIP